MLTEEIREAILAEVQKQLQPMATAVAEVRRQNSQQSVALEKNAASLEKSSTKILEIDTWRKGLWGNGSGVPGYLERARAEDKQKFEQMFQMISELKETEMKREGKDELLRELEANRIKLEQLADTKRTGRLTRLHIWLAIASSFAGAWTLTLVRPILHYLIQELLKNAN